MRKYLQLFPLVILTGATAVAHTIVSPGDHNLDLSATEAVRINVAVDCPTLADFSIRITYDGGILEYVADSGDFTSPRLLIEDAPQIVEDAPGVLRFTAHPFMNAGTESVDAGSGTLFSFELRGFNYGVYALDVEVITATFVSTINDSTAVQAGSVTVTGIGDIVFAPAAGHYAVAQDVALSSTDSEEIRYTTDGTEPDTNSTLYTVPVNISAGDGESVTVRAIAFDDHEPPRFLLGEAEYNFDTSLPSVAITPVATPRTTAVNSLAVVFNEAALNFTVAGLSLTRDGGGNLLPGGAAVTTVDSISWTLFPLSGHTAADGSYEFAVDASGITDLAGNALVAGDSINWAMDGPPSVTITPVAPDPITAAVAGVTFTFTEPVTGFDRGDLTLTRDGGGNLLDGNEVLNSGDDITFELSGLAAFTGDDGDYVLTLPGTGTGIADLSAKPLSAGAVESWRKDTVAPSLQIPAIVPDPRNSSVSEIMFVFDEPVTGFELADVVLRRDGGGNLLTAESFTTADNMSWTVADLAALTGAEGTYTAAIVPAPGVADPAGNVLGNDPATSWEVDTTVPTADFAAVTDPRNLPVDTVTFTFNEPVTGVGIEDLSLTRDGSGNLLTGGERVESGDNTTWTLMDLNAITGADGDYVLTLVHAGSGIIDAAANALETSAERQWHMDATLPTVAIEEIDPDPGNQTVSTIDITFDEPVTGLDLGDLQLKRDDSSLNLAGTAALAVNENVWTLSGLDTLTAVDGAYELTLTAAGSGIVDAVGNALASSATEEWSLDTDVPTVEITAVEDPRNSIVFSISLAFSEPITGLDIGDFSLQLDSGADLLTGSETLIGNGTLWTLSDLNDLTGDDGQYLFTLVPGASGIADAANNPLAAGDNIGWQMDTQPPTAEVTAVAPDPRNSAVDEVTITLIEAVTGFDKTDLTLTRDGSANLLDGSESLGSADDITFTLSGLTGFTAAEGVYTVTVVSTGAGIADAAGNLLEADASSQWRVDTTPPSLQITAIAPDPRNQPVADATLTFSEPVNGFDIGALSLTRDGGANLLTTQALTTVDNQAWTLDGLAGVTGVAGTYTLAVAAGAAVTDIAGNALPIEASAQWLLDLTLPTADFAAVTDPRSVALAQIDVTLSEPVTGVDVNDFSLTRDGGGELLSGDETVTTGDNVTWTLSGLTPVTGDEGDYVLTLSAGATDILDAAGNGLDADAVREWQMDRTVPTATIEIVDPDPRNLPVSDLAITFNEAVTGFGIEDLTLTRDGGPDLLPGTAALSGAGTDYQLSGLAALTDVEGNYTLELVAIGSGIEDLALIALEGGDIESWRLDTQAPTVAITPVSDPRNSVVSALEIVFSEPVVGFDISDLDLQLDNNGNLLTAEALTSTDNQSWTLSGLAALTAVQGQYGFTLAVVAAGIADGAGNALDAGDTIDWTMDTLAPNALITAVDPDPRNSAVATMTIVFDEAVTGFGIEDLSLTRDDGADLLPGATALASSDNLTWTLSGLDGLTGVSGQYYLALDGSGLGDAAGNAPANVDEEWDTDTVPPTVNISPVASPRISSVASIEIEFDKPVTGFDVGDLTLTRNAGGNRLFGSEPLTSSDNAVWTLGGIAGLTASGGDYELTITAPGGITDAVGNVLAEPASMSWNLDVVAPTVVIGEVATPRLSNVPVVTFTFSEAVSGFSLNNLTLTRDGSADLLGNAQDLFSGNTIDWQLTELGGLTNTPGSYVLSVQPDNVLDSVGNEMEVGAQISWDYGIGISGNITYDGSQGGTLTLEVFGGSTIAGDPLESHSLAGRATSYDIVMLQDAGTYSFRAFVDGGGGTYDAGEAVDAVSQLDVDLVGDAAGIDFELYDWTHAFDFAAGWHWISFPGPPLAPSFAEFQAAINGVVWGQAQQVVSVAAGQIAYWIYCHSQKSADIRGLNPVTEDTALVADWNLFGVSGNAVAPAVGGAYQSVVWTWEEERFESVAPGALLVPFKGYYVNVATGTVLEVE